MAHTCTQTSSWLLLLLLLHCWTYVVAEPSGSGGSGGDVHGPPLLCMALPSHPAQYQLHQDRLSTLQLWAVRLMLARLGGTSCRVLRCSGLTAVAAAGYPPRLAAPRRQHSAATAAAAAAANHTQQQQVAAPPPASMAVDSPRAVEQDRRHRKQRKQPDGSVRRPALWWKERPSYRCPACGQQCFKVPNFEAHILRCCPDVAPAEEWHAMLRAAAAQQAEAQQAQQQQMPVEQQEQRDGAPQADGQPPACDQEQAAASGEAAARAPPQWKMHPADAAIRAWLEQAEQREAQQRRRAVSAHAVPATPAACGWVAMLGRCLCCCACSLACHRCTPHRLRSCSGQLPLAALRHWPNLLSLAAACATACR